MTTIEELVSEIKEKAFKIDKKVGDVRYLQYFITPEHELYPKLDGIKMKEIPELVDKLGAPLHIVNFEHEMVFMYVPSIKADPDQTRMYMCRGKRFDMMDPILIRWIKEAAGVDGHGDFVAYK